MQIICLDLEGVLIPEIWIAVAELTHIDALRLTTRDIVDYDELMRHRLKLLDEHGLRLDTIQQTIGEMRPLEGAASFLNDLRSRYQVVILSDTFYEFATPLMQQLGWPTLFCHRLEVAADGRITGYRLRQADPKRHAVKAFQHLNFSVIAAGDSYNDISMLQQAQTGILFRPSDNVIADYPQLPVSTEYTALRAAIDQAAAALPLT